MFLRLKMLSDEECRYFHEVSVNVLSKTGVRFFKQEALDLLKHHGAEVTGNLVRMPASLVQKCLDACPREFTWTGPNGQISHKVRHEPLIAPAVGPIFIQDIKHGRRLATSRDYTDVIKILHALDVVNINGGIPVDICDLPPEKRYLFMMAAMLRHTNKPLMGFCLNKRLVDRTLALFEAASADDNIWEKGHFLTAVCTALSPLAMDEDTIDTIMAYASRNQIVAATSCIMAGISGPVTPLGSAVLQNAEILAGIVFTQCVRPGCPVLYSVASSAGDMKDASYGGGSPDAMMIHGPCIQTAVDLYDLPIRTMTGINSAKEADYQAGMETGMSALLSGLIGGGVWPQCLGILDDIMTLSYEKLILDRDTISRALHVRNGIEFSETVLSDIAAAIATQNNYLIHPDTLAYFSKLWTPKYMSWESRAAWERKGSISLLEKANREYRRILDESPETLLEPEQENALAKVLEKFM